MECFEHKGAEAIGICKSCNKSVCRECVIIFPKGMACSTECEQDAKELIEMNERGKKLYGIGQYKSNKLASGVWIWLLLTTAMLLAASYEFIAKGKIDYASIVTAILFLGITIIVYRSSKSTGIKC